MQVTEIRDKLVEKGLKVTPQRLAILEAIVTLNNHPTAEHIIDFIRSNHPNISTATVYKVLDALVANGLLKRVKTDKDIMRYDAILENHHHLYCAETEDVYSGYPYFRKSRETVRKHNGTIRFYMPRLQ